MDADIPITPMMQTSRRQYRNNCGAVSVYMMLDWMRATGVHVDMPVHRLESPETAINAIKSELNGGDVNAQTHIRDVARVLAAHGVPCRVASGTAVRIGNVLPPAILLVRYGDWRGNNTPYRDGHYVLWVGVDNDNAVVFDPLRGERVVPDAQFGKSILFSISPKL